ncbi:MAG: hypothetical protein AAFR39_04345 [Pseudomonadota bacterium]
MADVINFETHLQKRCGEPRLPTGPAQILIFDGVRYEQMSSKRYVADTIDTIRTGSTTASELPFLQSIT